MNFEKPKIEPTGDFADKLSAFKKGQSLLKQLKHEKSRRVQMGIDEPLQRKTSEYHKASKKCLELKEMISKGVISLKSIGSSEEEMKELERYVFGYEIL